MYMRKRGIKPLPRTEAERVEIGAHLSQAQYKRYGEDDYTLPKVPENFLKNRERFYLECQ